MIETRKLTKYFQDPEPFRVLNEIDLKIEAGTFCAIMGSSGSGKSTLLYTLSTLDTNYEGDILMDGKNLRSFSKDQLAEFRNEQIGFVFQFHYLLPEFTVLDNVKLPAMKLGRKTYEEIEQDALDKLALLDLKGQELKKASKLSGGQQQRVAIARALINRPAIIFGDEPTGNLDSVNAQRVFSIFKTLAQDFQQTIVLVTHDAELAQRTDRIIHIKDGQILPSMPLPVL